MQQKIPTIDIKKYGGKQVAVVNGRIVAFGETTREVLERARKKTVHSQWKEILLITVPRGLTVVYRL
ncbi:MAG: hypothetical protein G01um101470_25 [Parcubacteria group bacterium Gr01-1014_70]|nr:MAG: hypothetical protein G01um101470_25 [Parcubacteria group bacterium Gr01-1014_70]